LESSGLTLGAISPLVADLGHRRRGLWRNNPSGTNRIRLRGALLCADAMPADHTVRQVVSNTIELRIKVSP
jgi:hypothetical protein